MSERKAVNKYYPPEWRPELGSLNSFVRKRHNVTRNPSVMASLSDQPSCSAPNHSKTRTIRFELPFNIWCGSCDRQIAKGVRFNAAKTCTGQHFSTPIFSFSFNCPSCPQQICITTDPANADYSISSGARKQCQVLPTDTFAIKSEQDYKKQATDPFYRLEVATKDETKSQPAKMALTEIIEKNRLLWKDDYASSQLVRKQFRQQTQTAATGSFQKRLRNSGFEKGLTIPSETAADRLNSRNAKFKRDSGFIVNPFPNNWSRL